MLNESLSASFLTSGSVRDLLEYLPSILPSSRRRFLVSFLDRGLSLLVRSTSPLRLTGGSLCEVLSCSFLLIHRRHDHEVDDDDDHHHHRHQHHHDQVNLIYAINSITVVTMRMRC